MPTSQLILIAAALAVVLLGGLLVLRLRKGTGKTAFEAVEARHADETGGQLMKQREAGFLNIVYGLAASMVVADGRVEKSEVEMAERLGQKLIPGFDGGDFRKLILAHDQLPKFTDMVDSIAPLLPLAAKTEIFQYLQAIATADGNLSPDEKHQIHHVETQFGLDKLTD